MKQPRSAVKSRLQIIGVMCGTIVGTMAIEGSAGAREKIRDTRIIGGENAQPGQFPFAASLHLVPTDDAKDSQICGGTLIAPQWVLTAAHCVTFGLPASDYRVAVGHTKLSEIGEYIGVSEIFSHPDYTDYEGELVSADIALLHLETAVSGVSVAELASSGDGLESAGTITTAIGWGTTNASASITPNYLQYVEVPLLEDSDCDAKAAAAGLPYFSDVICAGYDEGGKDSCFGDSGGALLAYDASGAPKIVGIVAYGEGCAMPDNPGYYTRVSAYAGMGEWVESCLSGDPSCDSSVGGDFTCGDGSIIPGQWECDGASDCADGSDEADCEDLFFVCENGDSFPADWECDMFRDCEDGSDETECGHETFACEDGTTIPSFFECDGYSDCPAEEDELDCPSFSFECNDGSLIPSFFVCDSEPDCPEGEDEADILCKTPESLLETVVEAPGENCPNGGLAFHKGVDTNFDGHLGPEEIESTDYLCHGINDISRSMVEPKGANCGAGGQKVQFGLDFNGNDVLEDQEVRDTFFICNGEDGDDGALSGCNVSPNRSRPSLAWMVLMIAGFAGIGRRRRSGNSARQIQT